MTQEENVYTETTIIMMKLEQKEKLKEIAKEKKQSMSEFVREAIQGEINYYEYTFKK